MAEKKKFLLRIDGNIHAALEKWAADELRSINAQIEYLLTEAVKKAGRNTKSNSGSENVKNSSSNNINPS
jgi:hypothetical protein